MKKNSYLIFQIFIFNSRKLYQLDIANHAIRRYASLLYSAFILIWINSYPNSSSWWKNLFRVEKNSILLFPQLNKSLKNFEELLLWETYSQEVHNLNTISKLLLDQLLFQNFVRSSQWNLFQFTVYFLQLSFQKRKHIIRIFSVFFMELLILLEVGLWIIQVCKTKFVAMLKIFEKNLSVRELAILIDFL